MKKKIFDTSSLLLISKDFFEKEENPIIITNITLKELENIKTSSGKDSQIKYETRNILSLLDKYPEKWECLIYKTYLDDWIRNRDIDINNDSKILATAVSYMQQSNPADTVVFYTNDHSLKAIAKQFFKENLQSIEPEVDNYSGYVELYLNEEQMADFYTNPQNYGKDLYINQYINIYNKKTNERVDTACWTGELFRPLKYQSFKSKQFGEVKPLKGDIYQAMAADSLLNNQITILKGPAGSGKSWLAIGYLFYLLEKGKIDRIIIFCNTVATKNAAKLGFYPGSRTEKLLDSQIGNFLSSKLGGRYVVEELVNNEQLILLPMSDIRGYDTSGMNAGIYITEAQNLDVDLLKLALQRAGEDSIFILDGDTKSQVDLVDYEGNRNGMRRASQVFRGHNIYGEIELQQVHRSEIARLANLM